MRHNFASMMLLWNSYLVNGIIAAACSALVQTGTAITSVSTRAYIYYLNSAGGET